MSSCLGHPLMGMGMGGMGLLVALKGSWHSWPSFFFLFQNPPLWAATPSRSSTARATAPCACPSRACATGRTTAGTGGTSPRRCAGSTSVRYVRGGQVFVFSNTHHFLLHPAGWQQRRLRPQVRGPARGLQVPVQAGLRAQG